MSSRGDYTQRSLSFSVVLALVAAALFGAATPASKALLKSMSVFHLAGLLYLGAVLGISVELVRQKSWRSPLSMNSANRWRLTGAVVLGGVLGPVLLLLGLRVASAASVSLWLNLELVATAILGLILFRDHLGRFGWLGVAGVLTAGGLLSLHEGAAGIWAGLLVTGACICWGFDNHFTALIDGITPAQSTFWKGLVAGSTNLIIGVFVQPLQAPWGEITLALLIGAFSYGVSIVLYITSAQGIGATRAQMFFATAPFFGVILSALMLHEVISALQIVAAVLLVISLALLFRDQHHHTHAHEELRHEHLHRHDDGHHLHVHPDLDSAERHSHWHVHEPIVHAHPHWPDLHHRHTHSDSDDEPEPPPTSSG